jgi:hypothetical protein
MMKINNILVCEVFFYAGSVKRYALDKKGKVVDDKNGNCKSVEKEL